jgi:uncharacterized membrane protein YccC
LAATEESRQAVSRHRSALADLVYAVRDLAEAVDTCRRRLSADGPIGQCADPGLDRARERLDVAQQRLIEAAHAAHASREPCLRYVDRVFPA